MSTKSKRRWRRRLKRFPQNAFLACQNMLKQAGWNLVSSGDMGKAGPDVGIDGKPWTFRCVKCGYGTHTAHSAPGGWHCYRCVKEPATPITVES